MPRRRPPLHMQWISKMPKMRSKGKLTYIKMRTCTIRLCKIIYRMYGLENLEGLSRKHIEGAFRVLNEQGLSTSTLASYATAARLIADTINRPHIVPSNSELGAVRGREDRYRPLVTDEQKQQVIRERLYEKAEWLGLAHDLREAFGLRTKESLLSTLAVKLKGQDYLVVKGTKGGRPRVIPITTPMQATVLGELRRFFRRNPEWRSLVPPHMTLREALIHQRNALTAAGATKRNQANAHSLRHKFAQEMAGKLPQEELAKILGHGRTAVLRHYIETWFPEWLDEETKTSRKTPTSKQPVSQSE